MPSHSKFFDHETLTRARSYFPHTQHGNIYLNHAGVSPLSTRVVREVTDYMKERSEGRIDTYPNDRKMVDELRSMLCKLVKAESPERIAFQVNTSEAINVVAAGFPWKPGDRIVLNNIEFPANVYPYRNVRRYGVEIDTIQSTDGTITPEAIAAAITPRTRLVALSAVQFLSGHRADLAAIGALCRERKIIFAVDGIQAAGAVQVDVQAMKIDAFGAGGQKWLMAPHGTGFVYLTEELQSMITPSHLGWLSVDDPWKFYDYDQPLAPSATRFEGGSANMPGLWGLHASVSLLLEFGADPIERHILALAGRLADGFDRLDGVSVITPREDSERAGIVTITLPEGIDHHRLFKSMAAKNVTAAIREGKLRFSPHFYNSPDEMERTISVTAECLRNT